MDPGAYQELLDATGRLMPNALYTRTLKKTPRKCSRLSASDIIDDLFDEIPQNLHIESLQGIPEALSEMADIASDA